MIPNQVSSIPERADFFLKPCNKIVEIIVDEVEARDKKQCDECGEEHPVAEADSHGDQELCLEAPLQNDRSQPREGSE